MSRFNITLGDQGPWLLDLDTMLISEAEQCETLTGWSASQWRDALVEDRARALKFALWLARTRAGDPVAWSDIDFDMADFDFELVEDEPAVEPPADLGIGEDERGVVPTGPPAETQDTGA